MAGPFYAPRTKRNPRPMTFEADRKIQDWDREDPQTQAKDRALKQKDHMRSDVGGNGSTNGSGKND